MTALSTLRGLCALALVMPLLGCAVMRIDVDVYKGPLANQKDVHTEQVAVMAVSSRPLLLRLKKALEQDNAPTAGRAQLIRFVEDVEGLFEDRRRLGVEGDVLRLAHEAEKAARRVQSAVETLHPDFNESEQLVAVVEALRRARASKPTMQRLAKAYEEFVAPEDTRKFRNWGGVFKELSDLRTGTSLQPEDTEVLNAIPWDKLPMKTPPERSSSNGAFLKLQDKAFLAGQAKLLFGAARDKAEIATHAAFIAEVSRLAEAFTDARESQQELLEITLKGLSVADEVRFDTESERREVVGKVANFLADRLLQLHHLRLALDSPFPGSKAMVLRTAWENQLNALTLPGTNGGAWELNQWFRDKEEKSNSTTALKCDDWRDFDLQRREALAQAIAMPGAMDSNISSAFTAADVADALLSLQQRYRGQSLPSNLTDLCKRKYGQIERWKHGIVSGPKRGLDLEIADEVKSIADAVRASISPLHQGRLEVGLIRLVENYLDASFIATDSSCRSDAECSKAERRAKSERDKLLDALVRFAQKVLFVVNHEALFEAGINQSETYVQVLQTVGNSILVHVDAIRQEEDHDDVLVQAKDREIAAVRQVFGGGAGQAFSDLLVSLGAREDEIRRELENLTGQIDDAKKAQGEAAKRLESARKELAKPGAEPQPKSDMEKYFNTWISIGNVPNVLKGDAAAVADPKDLDTKTAIAGKTFKKGELPAFAEEIRKVLAAASGADGVQADRMKQLTDAASVFHSSAFLTALLKETPETKDAVLGFVDRHLKAEYDKLKNELAARKSKYKEAKKAYEKASGDVQAAVKDEEGKKGAVDRLRKKKEGVTDSLTQMATAREEMIKRRRKVVDAVTEAGKSPTGLAVYNGLRERLKEARRGLNPDNDKEKIASLDTAIQVVESLAVPPETISGSTAGAENAKDVLDGVIAALRHQKTRRLLAHEKESNDVRQASEALAEAYRQRGDMIHLRPAMAYLRTSFTVTSLQDDPRLGWQNMLGRHAHRSWPHPLSELLFKVHDGDRLRVVTEIDKQFWHNINSVRVAGGGQTNYAIIKDDIGNWSVKRYSSDPKEIIESAKSLALFSLGGQVDTNLLSRLKTQQQGGQQQAGASTMERFFLRFRDDFVAQTSADYDRLRAILREGTIEKRIRDSWAEDADIKESKLGDKTFLELLNAQLDAASNDPLKPALADLDAKAGDADDRGKNIVFGLNAVKSFHNRLLQRIADLKLVSGVSAELTEAETTKKAKDEAVLTAQSELTAAQAKLNDAKAHREGLQEGTPTKQADDAVANERKKVTSAEQKLTTAKAEARSAEQEVEAKKKAKEKAEKAELYAKREVTRIVREQILAFASQRQETVEDFEESILFLGEVSRPPEESALPASSAAAAAAGDASSAAAGANTGGSSSSATGGDGPQQ